MVLQDQGEGLQPVAYASKKLLPAEKNYATIEKECLAIVWGIQRFEPYLYGRQFKVQTDHSPLKQLRQLAPANSRLTRWSLKLQEYQFEVETVPGRDNVEADYLSRMAEEETETDSRREKQE